MYKKLLIIFILFSNISCEKQIEIHPENSEEKVFVEALYTNFDIVSYVKLKKTKGIYESITGHPPISNAIVNITDLTDNKIINCSFNGVDKYIPESNAIPGHKYILKIKVEDQEITGIQNMTDYIPLQNVYSYPIKKSSNKYYLVAHFNDPPETEDYYFFIIKPQNSNLKTRFVILSDYTFNRNNNTLRINNEVFNKGENWNVLFFHVDRKNYNYLDVVLRAMRALQSGSHPFYGLSMGNPPSTVEGKESLGFFIASPVAIAPIHIGN